MQNLTIDPALSNVFPDMKDQVEQLLLLLSERERFVIEKRFALDGRYRSTLEEIGQHFNVTRERVRQIEKNALQKLTRNIGNFTIFEVNNIAYEHLKKHGGLLSEDAMLAKLINESTGHTASALLFILSLDKRFVRLFNTIKCVPYFRMADVPVELISKIADVSLDILDKKQDVVGADELRGEVTGNFAGGEALSLEAYTSLYDIYKEFKITDEGIGLIKWKHINPRTLRDKIYYVLRKRQEPLHFVDIANAIVNESFDKKNVNLQAIHNELIRYDEFILIGRGIYALKEWGFSSGTVSDVVKSILKGKEHMSEDEIIKAVLKQRQVKPITIILNLKNKPQFIRVGRKQYALKK